MSTSLKTKIKSVETLTLSELALYLSMTIFSIFPTTNPGIFDACSLNVTCCSNCVHSECPGATYEEIRNNYLSQIVHCIKNLGKEGHWWQKTCQFCF